MVALGNLNRPSRVVVSPPSETRVGDDPKPDSLQRRHRLRDILSNDSSSCLELAREREALAQRGHGADLTRSGFCHLAEGCDLKRRIVQAGRLRDAVGQSPDLLLGRLDARVPLERKNNVFLGACIVGKRR